MKRLLVMAMMTTVFLGLLAGPAAARDGNVSQQQLERAGWDCSTVVAGEPHCVSPSATFGDRLAAEDPSIPVMVFGADGSFLGTEILIREDLYAGQPCPQDVVLELPFGYVGCHHYAQ